jgi:hypothetical protein
MLELSENRPVSKYRELSLHRKEEFIVRGLPGRYFFPHRAYYLPKCGPDALRLGQQMCGANRLDAHWEIVLYADAPSIEEFPDELFFDDDLIWHRQQLGRAGHIAFAYLVVRNGNLYGLNYVSDVVQRISRRRRYRTRIEKKFHGWHYMLLNSIMNFAIENNIKTIYSPASALIMAHTDPERIVQKELFERVYDRALNQHFATTKYGNWWVIDVQTNRDRLVKPVKRTEQLATEKTICISHDIERSFGHFEIDSDRVEVADRISREALTNMLRCEEALGIKATYNVLGCLFEEVRAEIVRGGHSLAFHSYDHQIRRCWCLTKHYYRARRVLASLCGEGRNGKYQDQLYRCRLVDRRVNGFRMPQSRVTAEWNDYNLVFRNFDWCAISDQQLRSSLPVMQNRLVKIPIHFDDFPLYTGNLSFGAWEKRLLKMIESNEFVAFGLHDCYADFWLPGYSTFLKRISGLGRFKTLDAVANETLFAYAI